jgi:hypothetical protein
MNLFIIKEQAQGVLGAGYRVKTRPNKLNKNIAIRKAKKQQHH